VVGQVERAENAGRHEHSVRNRTKYDAATLTLNGNNSAEWPLNQPWQDNLGAL